jgi:hypothetical protein
MARNPEIPTARAERRSFLSGITAGTAAAAGLVVGRVALADTPAAGKFEPTLHDQDKWMELGTKHRFLLDTHAAEGVANALLWGANYLRTSESAYGVKASDIGFIIVVRHRSVSFGYNDAMWAKYGEILSKQLNFVDPKTKEAPKTNVYNYGEGNSPRGTFETMAKAGVQIAVCSSATRSTATSLARATNQDVDAVVKELSSNLVTNGRMVPAGIITVAHAMERGYSVVDGS